jgi:hypothetical protein
MISLWLGFLIGVSVPSVLMVCWWMFNGASRQKRILLELAFILGAFGLIVQTSRSLFYFSHGHYPVDVGIPLWMTKDIAICLFVAHFAKNGEE